MAVGKAIANCKLGTSQQCQLGSKGRTQYLIQSSWLHPLRIRPVNGDRTTTSALLDAACMSSYTVAQGPAHNSHDLGSQRMWLQYWATTAKLLRPQSSLLDIYRTVSSHSCLSAR